MSKLFRVLLVEDDDPLRDVLMEVLSRRGWTVHAVPEPREALEIARSEPVDFSVLDLHLPGGTGLELLLRIRREIRPMPSILMSGAASAREFEVARQMGVFDFLHKPLQLPTFENTIDELVREFFERPGRPPTGGSPHGDPGSAEGPESEVGRGRRVDPPPDRG